LTPSDVRLLNRSTGETLPSDKITLEYDRGANRAVLSVRSEEGGSPLADGYYRLTLPAGSVSTPVGKRIAADYTFDFVVLAGDANRDRRVDFEDLTVLAQNYNTSGQTFDHGDFNYDGRVDFADLVIVAQRYNTIAPPPLPAPAPVAAATTAASTVLRDTPTAKPVFSVRPVVRPAPAKPKQPAKPQRR
jgi:hypothetical protein